MKVLGFFCLFSVFFLSRFSLNFLNNFSFSLSYLFIYIFLITGYLKGFFSFNLNSFLAFLGFIFIGFISLLNNPEASSFNSFLLMLFIYLPFTLENRYRTFRIQTVSNSIFSFFCILSFFGLLQFVIQFFYFPQWLFNFSYLIPDFFVNKNPMNTVIPIGGFFKSNGFFCLEPSIYSQMMAYGLYLSTFSNYPLFFIGIFFCALLSAFSGTGLLMALFIFFAFFKKSFIYKFIASLFFVFIGLSITVFGNFFIKQRLSEFTTSATIETSSAAARFLNPIQLVQEGLTSSAAFAAFGNGPGSINRVTKDFSFHDPTWAKLAYEYGIIGFCLFLFFIYLSLYKDFRSGKDLIFLLFFIQYFFLGVGFITFDSIALYLIFLRVLPFCN